LPLSLGLSVKRVQDAEPHGAKLIAAEVRLPRSHVTRGSGSNNDKGSPRGES
jgi:hypothetical protein